jgi:parallel beta-helix repeat protein
LVLLVLIAIFLVFDSNPQTTLAAPGDLFILPTSAGDCTQANPCSLATAMSQVEADDVLYFAAGHYTGSGDAVITIEDSITMYGGWDGTTSDPVVRDPEAYPSILDGEDSRRVIFIEEGTAPVIDGFTITGGNATGLRGGVSDGEDGGGGIYSYNASPIIKNNVITDNIASTEAGIRAFGGGIYLQNQTAIAEVSSNEILSNTAGDGINHGDGGGLFVYSPAIISQNTFKENIACVNCSTENGGAIYVGWLDNLITITNNIIEQNQAAAGAGIYQLWSATYVHQNILRNNYADNNGGAISLKYDEGSLISANQIYSNTTKWRGGGIYIDIAYSDQATQIQNNWIANNQSQVGINYAGGIQAESDWHLSWITATHNTLVGNGIGIVSGYHMTSTLINNIIVSHTHGISTTSFGGVVYPDHNLFWQNDDDGLVGTNPVYGNPSFVDADQGDYHILVDSSAKDAGIDAGVTIDMDNHPRPIGLGFDIGADEYGLFLYLPFIAR